MTNAHSTSRSLVTVGYDGSDTSRTAVLWAAREAAARAAALRIVTAWDPSPITPWSLPELPRWRDQARQAADQAAFAAQTIAGDHIDATSVAVEGPAGKVLVAESTRTDLLVVGSAGHLGTTGWLTGSVSRYLAHHSACPVVVLGPRAHVDPVRRLVVSSNLDPDGETDSWLAGWLEHRPVAVHVVGSFHLTAVVPDWLTKDVQANIRASVRERNAEWTSRLRRRVGNEALITEELVEGTVSVALRRVTRAGDLIVVPPTGEHAIPVSHRGCPVAVMPYAARTRRPDEVEALTAAGTS